MCGNAYILNAHGGCGRWLEHDYRNRKVRREDMERRYTQGAGRRGEEAEQLRVRCRLVQVVRDGLARFGRPWWELPRDLSSWDVLIPGAAARLGPDAGDEQ